MEEFPPPLSANVVGSFAYKTVKDRLPVILTRVIDLLFRDRNEIAKRCGQSAHEETKAVIGRLSKLRNEMQTDKFICHLQSNSNDTVLWNQFITQYIQNFGCEPSWFTSPWLLVECYMYRRIREAFELTTLLTSFDPFRGQKENAFLKSINVVAPLCTYLSKMRFPVDENNTSHRATVLKDSFQNFIELSLWGNKCDLSLSSGEQVTPTDNPLQETEALRDNILANDSLKIYELVHLKYIEKSKKLTIHIVLDNAGFELFSDLCLVDFLIRANLIDRVYFHVKLIPWFVSDTLEYDFKWLLKYLVSSEKEDLRKIGEKWQGYVSSKIWQIVTEMFWTLPHDYSLMKTTDPNLYNLLSQANLIIFKGDLNYRKLTGDLQWNHTTPFKTSLRGFCPAPLCTLRTIKAEVVVGLKEETVKEISSKHSNWMYSGEFAVIQYSE